MQPFDMGDYFLRAESTADSLERAKSNSTKAEQREPSCKFPRYKGVLLDIIKSIKVWKHKRAEIILYEREKGAQGKTSYVNVIMLSQFHQMTTLIHLFLHFQFYRVNVQIWIWYTIYLPVFQIFEYCMLVCYCIRYKYRTHMCSEELKKCYFDSYLAGPQTVPLVS